MAEHIITDFKGIRNDKGSKHIEPEYFFDLQNMNFNDLVGATQVLCPKQIKQPAAARGNGLFEYRYFDAYGVLQSEIISVQGTSIYKNSLTTPVLLSSSLLTSATAPCDFSVLDDRLLITNGVDDPVIYWGLGNYVYPLGSGTGPITSMGAPFVVTKSVFNPLLAGTYYYRVVYTTSAGDEDLGTKTVAIANPTGRYMRIYIPRGYTGVTKRKLYRATTPTGTYRLIYETPDNGELIYPSAAPTQNYYDDYTLPADWALKPALGTVVSNPVPRPKFVTTSYYKMIGVADPRHPTQGYTTDTNLLIWDSGSYFDVSNVGDDNTSITGIAQDYSQVIISTMANQFICDASGSTVAVKRLRANIGTKSGYSMAYVPASASFDGGVMFVSTMNDVRLISGSRDIIPNTVNDITTENWAQVIKATITLDIQKATIIYAEFFDYKYHLVLDSKIYVFDIRTLGWSVYKIATESYTSLPTYLAIIGNKLYSHQTGGYIEEMYADVVYRTQNLPVVLQSPHIMASDKWVFMKDLVFWYLPIGYGTITIEVETNDDSPNKITATLNMANFDFDWEDYLNNDFAGAVQAETYFTVHVNRMARWFRWKIYGSLQGFAFRGVKYIYDEVINKEG